MGIDGKNESKRSRSRGSDGGAMGTSLSITKKSEYKHKQECKLQMGKERTQRYHERARWGGEERRERTTCHMLFAFVKQTRKWMLVVKICWLFKYEKWVASCSRWTLFVSSAPASVEVFDPQQNSRLLYPLCKVWKGILILKYIKEAEGGLIL